MNDYIAVETLLIFLLNQKHKLSIAVIKIIALSDYTKESAETKRLVKSAGLTFNTAPNKAFVKPNLI